MSFMSTFHKWYAPYARETQFNTLAGKLPEDIVDKIMSFWSPGYPFLNELKSFYWELDIARITFADELLEAGYDFDEFSSRGWEYDSDFDDDLVGLWFSECDTPDYRADICRCKYCPNHIYSLWEIGCEADSSDDSEYHWKNGIMRGALLDRIATD
tara:strand:+ start:43 stop:510 length:468 start_codon:yes stop_codon:yes gene_type:complete